MCDPALPASQAKVAWRPEFIPTAIILAPAPQRFRGATKLSALKRGTTLDDRTGLDGRHIVLADPREAHRVWIREPASQQPMAVVIPLDDDFPLRVAGALRFRRWLEHTPSGSLPRSLQLTKRYRDRLVLMLHALDMSRGHASYREITAALFGEKAVLEHGWKTLPVRGRTIRLVHDAKAMVDRGYLKLLRGG